MIIKEITIQKSKTIEVAGVLGRDTYRKIVIGASCAPEEGETAQQARENLNNFIDKAIADEIVAMNSEVAKQKTPKY